MAPEEWSNSYMANSGCAIPLFASVPKDCCLRQKSSRSLRYCHKEHPGSLSLLNGLCIFFGGLLLALAIHFALPRPARERRLEVHGFHVVRELLFAFGFLLIVLLVSEPFLTQESQKGNIPFRFRLPTAGSVVPAGNTGAHSPIMNQFSLLTLLLFFVLQALIYVACLVKLAEIRRQNMPARLKLKLLENEDHLSTPGFISVSSGRSFR